MYSLVAEHRPYFSLSSFWWLPLCSEQPIQSYVVVLALLLLTDSEKDSCPFMVQLPFTREGRILKRYVIHSWESMLYKDSQYMNSQENY